MRSLNWVLHDPMAPHHKYTVPWRFVLRHPRPMGDNMTHATPAILIGGNKLTSEGPYLQLFNLADAAFKRASMLTIVGYSFRDDHVNTLIVSFVNRNRYNRLRVVDPDGNVKRSDFMSVMLATCADRIEVIPKTAKEGLRLITPVAKEMGRDRRGGLA